MHIVFKKTDELIKKLVTFVTLIEKDFDKKQFNLLSYKYQLKDLTYVIFELEESLYKYWGTFKYENYYWCELPLMRTKKQLKSAKNILAKTITLDTVKKIYGHIFNAYILMDDKFTGALGDWRSSVGRCSFNFEAEGQHYFFRKELKQHNWSGGYQAGQTRKSVFSRPRSYIHQRIPQMLRHISRLIYYVLKTKGIDPVEVETMYWKKRNILFISTNNPQSLAYLKRITSKKSIAEVLFIAREYKPTSYREKKIIDNTLKKMLQLFTPNSNRMQNWSTKDKNIINNIIKLIAKEKANFLTVPNSIIARKNSLNNDNIYILDSSKKQIKNTFVHAELWFVYVLQNKLHSLAGEEIWIFGKKRPCFTCYCQLGYIAEKCLEFNTNIILHFNPHPGKVWYAQGKFFTDNCLQDALDILPHAFNYVTTSGGKQYPGYDSDSDSDCE